MIFKTGGNVSLGIINHQPSEIDHYQSGSVSESDLIKQDNLHRGTMFIRAQQKMYKKSNVTFHRFRSLIEHTNLPKDMIHPHHNNTSYFSIPFGKYVSVL